MKKKLLLLLSGALLVFSGQQAIAQCDGGRYLNEIFSGFTLDSTTYSTPYSLKMDVYQPAGDTLTARPLIIWAHEGSFIGGDRESDSTVVRECRNFAMRGYVTASIDYRLGNELSMVSDSNYAISVVVKAISDGKAAIRYFVQDAVTANTYKIDTNRIFIGGNSAGSVLYMHVAYMTDTTLLPTMLLDSIDANGGFEGNSGNAGYNTKFNAMVNYAGGLNRPYFITHGNVPSSNAQGTADNVVPYTCADAIMGLVQVTLCGLGNIEAVYDSMGIDHVSYIFEGAGHVPWDTNDTNFNSIDSQTTQFLYHLVCAPAGVAPLSVEPTLQLYPNPTNTIMELAASDMMNEITIQDITGRTIYHEEMVNGKNWHHDVGSMLPGLYFVRVGFVGNASPIIKRLLIE
jgi:hypothetical protein